VAEESIGDRIRRGVEAFNAGDHDGVIGLLADDVEWKRVEGLPDTGAGWLHGKEAVREFLEPEVFDVARIEPLEVVEGGGTVLISAIFHARGAGSGIEMRTQTFLVYVFNAAGLAERVENWRTREDAERSSGLRFSG
jgi:ketosteroid isomerase-like protein